MKKRLWCSTITAFICVFVIDGWFSFNFIKRRKQMQGNKKYDPMDKRCDRNVFTTKDTFRLFFQILRQKCWSASFFEERCCFKNLGTVELEKYGIASYSIFNIYIWMVCNSQPFFEQFLKKYIYGIRRTDRMCNTNIFSIYPWVPVSSKNYMLDLPYFQLTGLGLTSWTKNSINSVINFE